NGAPQPFVRF
uniref:FMRFamide-like neuropeptide PF6 n=1 Tax=Panagrellus redivivus TaxID=6233 RepID=FAR6_PANRE|nr:RecName: Full=FMRFamide-like neuropeptide PF6; AltName: Full=NGAPQPFVRF-amide [Panagrellus redivivus]